MPPSRTKPSPPTDAQMLDFLDTLPSKEQWNVKVAHGCVFVCKNSSSGHGTVREAIAAFMQAQPSMSDTIAAGKIITLGISPARGRKNVRLARKKDATMNLKIETVTLKRRTC